LPAMRLMTIPFAIIIALSVATTHISAIKGQTGSILNAGSTVASVCNNNVLCYTTIEQEKEVKVPERNYKSIQMLEKTDLRNKTISALRNDTISAIASAEARKRAYEHNLTEIQKNSWNVMSGTIDSVPEIHTEGIHNIHHEVAIILPPETGKIYEGVIAYSASSNVQPSSLYGPVNQSERKGQLAASFDGKTFYAVTAIPADQTTGTWQFAGNVLIVHNPFGHPFSVNYIVVYREYELSKDKRVETVQSNSSHLLNDTNGQVAMIVPPTENHYSGILCYSASKDVHVVVFHGPVSPEEDKGQKIWSPDNGKTKYELVLVDPGNNMANFAFSGNGLAIVSLRDVPFTISYAIVSRKS
jgi:hypothetical protein